MKHKISYIAATAIEWHKQVNQFYDNDKPYSIHIYLTVDYAHKYKHLIDKSNHEDVICACYLHDVIEDTRHTYNDVKKLCNTTVADIVYAVTNEKGRNRAERANDRYYEGIRNNPLAQFVKLCDRLANVRYSFEHKSKQIKMYQKENDDFIQKIGNPLIYKEMIHELELLTIKK